MIDISHLTGAQIAQSLKDLGTLGLLAILVWGFLRGWIVPKWVYDAAIAERDQWRSVATDGIDSVKQLVELADLVRPRQSSGRRAKNLSE